MVEFKTRTGRFLMAALLAAACMAASAPTVYADGPSGPASDTGISLHKDTASGPGAQFGAGQPVGTEAAAGQTGTEAAGAPTGAETAPPAEQPVPADGLVLSGGRYIDPAKPMLALTFDDGPYAPVGNRIMDRLEQNNSRATFFVVGNRVASYKTEMLRMQNNGHEVANHTQDHKYLTKLGAAEIRSQIDRCNQAVASVTGVSPTLSRLPGGLKNQTVLANVNMPMIMWNIDTRDWKTRNPQSTVAAVLGKVQDGDVVLMHELYAATADAVDVLVPALVEQGYQLVTVSELAQFRGGVQAGGLYNQFRP